MRGTMAPPGAGRGLGEPASGDGALTAGWVTEVEQFRALRAAWSALAPERGVAGVFRTWEWLFPWWRHFGGDRDLRLLVARDAGGVVRGIVPLMVEELRLAGLVRCVRLGLLGTGVVGSDYLGLVAAPGDEARVAAVAARALADHPADRIDLDDVLADEPLVRAWAALGPEAGRRLRRTPRYVCPYLRPSGGFAAYLDGLADEEGARYRRKARWLARRGGLAVEVEAIDGGGGAALEGALDDVLRLHQARWRLEGGSEAIDSPRVEAFHREAGRAVGARGWLWIRFLRASGTRVAALYGFRVGRRLQHYQAGHAPEWRSRSVGTVLLGRALEECFAEGIEEVDLLRGDEAYKLRWADRRRLTERWSADGRSTRARLGRLVESAVGGARRSVRAALPPGAVEALRRVRRRLRARSG